MAHRAQFSKDLILPKEAQEYRVQLLKQIKKVRQHQKLLVEQSNQKLLFLERRLMHGRKKKIFAFDKQLSRMTLGDQLSHFNLEIDRLKAEILNEQKAIRENESPSNTSPIEDNLLREVVLETSGMRKQAMELLGGNEFLRVSNQIGSRQDFFTQVEKMSVGKSAQKQLKLTLTHTDPQQQLMSLTHEIIRLKKSLQQVRSKYSQNFTEYKLKQQLQKLRSQNEQIALELKQLQMSKKLVDEATSASNSSDVNYDQLEVIRAKKEFETLARERNLLKEYCGKLETESEERMESDERRVRQFREEKISRVKGEIEQVRKQNQILIGEIQLTEGEIQRCHQRYLQLRGRVSSNV